MGGRQKSEGDRQETGDRRLSAVTRSQAWEKKDGLVSDDGWYKVLSVDGAGELAGFPAPFSRRVRRRQRGMRRGARTARCTLCSRGREWLCGGKRRGRALEGAMELKKSEAG
jgi:hypothetical protein